MLVPVSLPSDESKRLVETSKCFESFRGGIESGFDRSIALKDFSSLECQEEKLVSGRSKDEWRAS